MNILIGTTGFSYRDWHFPGVFYPPNTITVEDQLRYYMSKFDILTISSTYEDVPATSMYETWAKIALEEKPGFSFIVVAPKKFTNSHSIADSIEEWSNFWEGSKNLDESQNEIKKGGCKILYEAKVLGCLLLQFPSSFYYNEKHVNKIKKITKNIPLDVKLSFEFLHSSWRENCENTKKLFSEHKNWCISTSLVENGLVDFGWAGNIISTRTHNAFSSGKMPSILVTTNFAHISLSGTYGPQLGSYDKDGFLERFAADLLKLGKLKIFCSFDATTPGTTFCNPLPGIIISGFFLNPKLADLPSHTDIDRPCCLHDSLRFQQLLKTSIKENSSVNSRIRKTKYRRDSEGFVVIEFKMR